MTDLSALPAPSTAAGSTRCPECADRFSDDPSRPTTLIRGSEPSPARRGYRAGRAGQHHPVAIRWHSSCLAGFEARNAALRAQVARDRLVAVASIVGGLEPAARDAALAGLPDADRAVVLDLIHDRP